MEHEFALYLDNLSHILKSQSDEYITIDDKDFFHRLVHVLRMHQGQKIILFDAMQHVEVLLDAFEGKSRVIGHIRAYHINKQLMPTVHFILPVLKREDLSEAVYGLAEAGVNSIQLVTTQKVQRVWGGQKELERLERVIIAAGEQAKQFSLPTLHAPIELSAYLVQLAKSAYKMYADPEGMALTTSIQQIPSSISELYIMVGPEGDLTPSEKELVHAASFNFFKLTPTILRAKQAAIVSAAVFRSIV
ncbi:MAG TPA: RsmE family RNA methyltransferase [Candidatus Dependentiae bacterium]|nr:RsmE family RNA methyltransferase [Candidatus Dependentiae bacterium]HRQ62853.1 RsmE family RNA methyltransferase [Candidatus Dependentiae bacterium]